MSNSTLMFFVCALERKNAFDVKCAQCSMFDRLFGHLSTVIVITIDVLCPRISAVYYRVHQSSGRATKDNGV